MHRATGVTMVLWAMVALAGEDDHTASEQKAISEQDEKLTAAVEAANTACGTKLTAKFDWKSESADILAAYRKTGQGPSFAVVLCTDVVRAVERVCIRDPKFVNVAV